MSHYSDPNFPRPRNRPPRADLPLPSAASTKPSSDLEAPKAPPLPTPIPREAPILELTFTSSINRWSLAGGLLSSAAALLLLLDEPVEQLIRHNRYTFGLDHALTIALLSVTTILGHLSVKSWQARRIGGSIAFPLLFVLGTGLTIYNSATRQSLVDERALLEASTANTTRADRQAELDKMRLLRDATTQAATAACKKEWTDTCKGKKATRDFYQRAVNEAELKLASAPAPQLATTKPQQFAKLLSDLGVAVPATIVAAFLPFALALFFELTSIACYVNLRRGTFR